jgi:hypothetical protein
LRPNELGCEQERPDHTLVQQHGDLALVSSASLSILQLKGLLVLDLRGPHAELRASQTYASWSRHIFHGGVFFFGLSPS